MKKEKIKPLPAVKAFTDYFIRKAKRSLRLKKADFDRVNIDYTSRGTIWVWFFKDKKNVLVGKVVYNVDGRKRF